MISVVIPLYNKAATIRRALDSVLAQTCLPHEVVVVDDGSTDGGAAVVRGLGETPVPVRLVRQENQGVSAARNRGIAEAQGDWIAFLDADDQWETGFLEEIQLLQHQHPEAHLCATAYSHVDQQGHRQELKLNRLPFSGDRGLLDNYFEVSAHSHPPIWSSAVCIRKASLLRWGGFPLGVSAGEDLLTWARLALSGPIAYSRRPLATFFPPRASYYSRPSREPQADDPVGRALESLYFSEPNRMFFREYIGLWHKMRASIYLRLPRHGRDCRKEAKKALFFCCPKRWKLHIYRLLSLLPYKLRMHFFQWLP